MYSKLLHILLLMNAVWLLPSCQTDIIDDNDDVAGSEMRFAISSGQSRASLTTALGTEGAQFAIFGDKKFKDNDKTTIFDNDIVEYSNGNWVYDTPRFWFPLFEYSFIAMHPVTADGISDRLYSDSRLSFTYTLPDDFRAAKDLMLATHRRKVGTFSSEQATASETAPVSLEFRHIMSRINFRLTNAKAADIVRVEKIVLEGVNNTGSFSINPASLSQGGSQQTDDYDFSLTNISNPVTLTANISIDVPENEARSLFPDDDALLVMPQPDNKSVIMHITYTLIDADADDEHVTLTAVTPIGGWESGKIYTYSLKVEELAKDIYLTVSVKNWQKPGATPVPVPES